MNAPFNIDAEYDRLRAGQRDDRISDAALHPVERFTYCLGLFVTVLCIVFYVVTAA